MGLEESRPGSESAAFAGKVGGRFWDVDVVRGIAMVLVATYHFVYDLDFLAGYPVNAVGMFWGNFADTSAFMFVFLAGLSLALSHQRARMKVGPEANLFPKYLRRGLRIFGYGMGITVVFWVLKAGVVIFGILHMLGVSIILAYPFLRRRWTNLFFGLSVVAAGAFIQADQNSFVLPGVWGFLLAPFGVFPAGVYMADYRALLPWFGVVLLGLFVGNTFYLRRRDVKPLGQAPRPMRPLAFVGRHTLFIYLIHQPILIALLWAFGVVNPSAL